MVVLAGEHAVVDAGGAAVFFVFDVVDVGDGGGAVAAGGPGAVFVTLDDGAADGVGDGVAVADVEDDAAGVEGCAKEVAPEGGGEIPLRLLPALPGRRTASRYFLGLLPKTAPTASLDAFPLKSKSMSLAESIV